MDDKEQGMLSSQEKEINAILNKAKTDIKYWEEKMKSPPRADSPQLNNALGGTTSKKDNPLSIDQIKNRIEDIKAKAITDTDKIGSTLPKELQKSSKDNATKTLYPQREEANKIIPETDAVDKSQAKMMNITADHLRKEDQKTKSMSASDKFMSGLKSNKNNPGKEEKNKDATAPQEKKGDKGEAGYSMSTQFKQGLSFERSQDKDNGPKPPTKGKGIDKEKE